MSERYDQVRKYGSANLFYKRLLGIGIILLGIALYRYASGDTTLPGAPVTMAALMAVAAIIFFRLVGNFVRKRLYIRRHTKSKLMDAEVEISVYESGIYFSTPFSSCLQYWSSIERVIRTPKGILVWDIGGCWFLPESIVGKKTIDFIEAKVA